MMPANRVAGDCPPPGCPGGVSPGKDALLPGTTAAFTSATEPTDFAVWCLLVASQPALLCGSCPSARRFPLAFLPLLGYPCRVGFEW